MYRRSGIPTGDATRYHLVHALTPRVWSSSGRRTGRHNSERAILKKQLHALAQLPEFARCAKKWARAPDEIRMTSWIAFSGLEILTLEAVPTYGDSPPDEWCAFCSVYRRPMLCHRPYW